MSPIPPATPRQLLLVSVLCKERGLDYAEACEEALLDTSEGRFPAALSGIGPHPADRFARPVT